jgi:hypothetical protein
MRVFSMGGFILHAVCLLLLLLLTLEGCERVLTCTCLMIQ